MAYMPPAVPSRTTVEAVLNFAQNVAHDFGSAPAIFSSGERAAIELASELTSYQELTSALNSNNSSNQTSPLTANLIPCRDALENLSSIRSKYPHGRDAKLRLSDNLQWNTMDKREFEVQVAKLREDTGRLRELVRELQRSAIESLKNHQQQQQQQQQQQPQGGGVERGGNIYGAHVVQATVSVASSSTSSFPPQPRAPRNNPYAPSKSKANLPMCPNGPGCRTPSCGFEFNHPRAEACGNGKNCSIPGCQLFHPKAAFCDKGPSCPMVGCEKAHPWPRQPPTPAAGSVYSYAPSDRRSFASPSRSVSDMSTISDLTSRLSVSDISSVEGTQSTQSTQPFDRDSSRDFPQQQFQQRSWTGPGGSQGVPTRPATTTGPSNYSAAQSQSAVELQGRPAASRSRGHTYRNSNTSGQQEWCKLRFDCPGGYNGQCPLRHPKRTPCWDFRRGNCPRGASCTFYHGPAEVSGQSSRQEQARAPGQYVQAYAQAQIGAQYAELSGTSRSQPVAELPGSYTAELPVRRY